MLGGGGRPRLGRVAEVTGAIGVELRKAPIPAQEVFECGQRRGRVLLGHKARVQDPPVGIVHSHHQVLHRQLRQPAVARGIEVYHHPAQRAALPPPAVLAPAPDSWPRARPPAGPASRPRVRDFEAVHRAQLLPEVLHGEVRVALALERAHLLDGRQRDARAPRLATAVVDQPVIPVALPALLQPPQVSGRDPQDVCCLNPRQLPGDRLHDHFLPALRLYLSGHPSLDALHRRLCSRQRPTSLSAYTPGHLQCSLHRATAQLTRSCFFSYCPAA